MNTMRNSVQLIGRPGNDPEVKTVTNNRKVARFSIATNDYYMNDKNERVDETYWHNIVAWGKCADMVEKHVKKGLQVALSGKLTSRVWSDKDGNKHYITEVVLLDLLPFEKPEE